MHEWAPASPFDVAEDCLKLQFFLDAMDCSDPFKDAVDMPQSVIDAIRCAALCYAVFYCIAFFV